MREQVLTGLRSRELCTMLLGTSHEDADDLLHDIQELEESTVSNENASGQRLNKEWRVMHLVGNLHPRCRCRMRQGTTGGTSDHLPQIKTTTPPASVVKWVRLSPQCNATGTELFDNFGHEIINDMTGRDITVSVFTSGEQHLVICKGQRVEDVMVVDTPVRKMEKYDSGEERGAAESEQIQVTRMQRPITRVEITVSRLVTESQRHELTCLSNVFQYSFTTNFNKLEWTPFLATDIQERLGSVFVAVRPYHTSAAEREPRHDVSRECEKARMGTETLIP
ncbi:hypothetical protein HPB51_005691 [Rhipicephalus microplus]|uniref:Uncharacterized protein n=1 Tax=Rhipicephalus microplus TaxID=6941 RepID=A0A9J6EYJ1_RHIMP|nr:hypothetical protein HPB51_005691 [Rhipicephalus microplus]